jgi:hypothetical protein
VKKRLLVGVDGEGHDLPDGRHVYTYLAAVNEEGCLVAEVSNPKGLSHNECMRCLLAIPTNTLCVGYSLGYDIAKWIQGLSAVDRYFIMRPEHRQGSNGYAYHYYVNGRKYDAFGGSFSVKEVKKGKRQYGRQRTVHDLFRFFGTSFVEALKKWHIGTPAERLRIADMKNKRGSFAKEKPAVVKAYCRLECHFIAQLARKLIEQHNSMGLKLARYTGAGATANALLRREGVEKYIGPKQSTLPIELQDAIMHAFVGGRFEHSIVGPVKTTVHSYDVAGAYPYAASSLPCLACGTWRRVDHGSVEGASLALCRFTLAKTHRERAWGPLPFRDAKGSILFPFNFKGWAWLPEIAAAARLYPGMVHVECAWVYETDCAHRPFAWVPEVYRERVKIGSDTAGLVLKLALNAATYGMLAQSRGRGRFTNYAWAGMVAATTRAQLLDAVGTLKEEHRWDVLSVATDGLHSCSPLDLPKPRDTGTGDLEHPLGSWVHEVFEQGAMFVRPGLVYRFGAEVEQVRARGVGRAELHRLMLPIEQAWQYASSEQLVEGVEFPGDRRFYGAKTSILGTSACRECGTFWPGPCGLGCPKCGQCGDRFAVIELTENGKKNSKKVYGRWIKRPVKIAFDAAPKRECVLPSIPRNGAVRLTVKDVDGAESAPFVPGNTTPEGRGAAEAKEGDLEQPEYSEGG